MSNFDKFAAAIARDAAINHLKRQLRDARTNAQKTRLENEIAECAARIQRRLASTGAN